VNGGESSGKPKIAAGNFKNVRAHGCSNRAARASA
jgi:hypothetical protein